MNLEKKEIKIFSYIDGYICDDNIFADSKLDEALAEVLAEAEVKVFLKHLQRRCSSQELGDRQELFKLLPDNDVCFLELEKLRKYLGSLSMARECIGSEKDEISASLWKIIYIGRFCEFVKATEDMSMQIIDGSKLIRQFSQCILEYTGIVYEAKEKIDIFYNDVDKEYRSSYVAGVKSGEVYGSNQIKYNKKKDINCELAELINSVFPELTYIKKTEGYTGRARHRYLSKIVKDTDVLKAKLSDITDNYKEVLDFNEKILIEHIDIIDSYVRFLRCYKEKGIVFSFPEISDELEVIKIRDISLVKQGCSIVPSDLYIDNKKRTVLITGANSGGKTSFMRAMEQVVIFAYAGLPVNAERARVPEGKFIYSFFETDENDSGLGRFIDEKTKINSGMAESENSIVFINEMFSSTYENRSTECISQLIENNKDNLLFVNTHFLDVADKISKETTEYLMTEIKDEKPTHKIVKGIYGESVTRSILKKYKMTKEDLFKAEV